MISKPLHACTIEEAYSWELNRQKGDPPNKEGCITTNNHANW